MRILYVTRQLAPHGVGGIGTYVETLAGLMSAAGHEITVLSASPEHGRSTDRSGSVVIERFGAVGPSWLWRRLAQRSEIAASRARGALSAWMALRRLRGSFDVIEAPEWKAEGLLLRWPRRGAVVVHLHLPLEVARRWRQLDGRAPRGVRFAEWLERRSARHADAVTATSELSRTLPGGSRWCPELSVTVVPPPMVLDAWTGTPPVEGTGPVVLFVGHLEHRKAPEVLMEALGMLAPAVPGLRAVFVGRPFMGSGGEPYDRQLRAQAARLGVDCELLPPKAGVDAMRQLYGMARVVAVPSRYETLSMVALEGFACGRPVVMTDATGAAEWVRRGVPDLVVRAGDAEALAAAMRPLLLDASTAARHGEGGRAALVERCGVEAIVRSREAVYAAALARAGRRSRGAPARAWSRA